MPCPVDGIATCPTHGIATPVACEGHASAWPRERDQDPHERCVGSLRRRTSRDSISAPSFCATTGVPEESRRSSTLLTPAAQRWACIHFHDAAANKAAKG